MIHFVNEIGKHEFEIREWRCSFDLQNSPLNDTSDVVVWKVKETLIDNAWMLYHIEQLWLTWASRIFSCLTPRSMTRRTTKVYNGLFFLFTSLSIYLSLPPWSSDSLMSKFVSSSRPCLLLFKCSFPLPFCVKCIATYPFLTSKLTANSGKT